LPDSRIPGGSLTWPYSHYCRKDHFAADRQAAEQLKAAFPPAVDLAVWNREFLGRAVAFLARLGIRQFLDIGCGLPTQGNVHEVARAIAPDSRVVYVDNDPSVITHARALLATSPAVTAIQCDLRDPEVILEQAARSLDFSQPVAVLLVAVLPFLRDDDAPGEVLRILKGALAPDGSLALNHVTDEHLSAEARRKALGAYDSASPINPRPREQVMEFFTGLDLVPPGLVDCRLWQPGVWPDEREAVDGQRSLYAGVAIKPA
jgi:SAM-dependent methyltransferase